MYYCNVLRHSLYLMYCNIKITVLFNDIYTLFNVYMIFIMYLKVCYIQK